MASISKRVQKMIQREFIDGVVYRVDLDRVDVAPAGSSGILRSLPLTGDRDKVQVGDSVRVMTIGGERIALVGDVAFDPISEEVVEDASAIVLDERLAAVVAAGGAEEPRGLRDLADVDLATAAPVNNNILAYDETARLWVPKMGGGGSDAATLTGLAPDELSTENAHIVATNENGILKAIEINTPTVRAGAINADGIDATNAYIENLSVVNDGSGSGLDADTVDGKHAGNFLPGAASSVNTIAGGAGVFPQVMAAGSGAGAGAAAISFHRPSNYAVNFGLDTDNQLKVGGWSAGAAHKIHHDGNHGRGYNPTDNVVVTNGVQVLNGSQSMAAGDYTFNLAYFLPAAAYAEAFFCRIYGVSATPGSNTWVGTGRVNGQWSVICRPPMGGTNQWNDAHGIVVTNGGANPTFNVHVNGATMQWVFMLVFGYFKL